MKESFYGYAIIPPLGFDDEISLKSTVAITVDGAWHKFCNPSLNREAYEGEGFNAKKVKITIEVVE
jgi:hypothetical protein